MTAKRRHHPFLYLITTGEDIVRYEQPSPNSVEWLDVMRALVGGSIDRVPPPAPRTFWANEEGILMRLPVNRFVTSVLRCPGTFPLVGPIVWQPPASAPLLTATTLANLLLACEAGPERFIPGHIRPVRCPLTGRIEHRCVAAR